MATTGKTWSGARAVCLRPEHAGGRVRFDGQYGKPGHRRQLYRCVPSNGDRAHCFTEVLPREEAWRESCELCERPVHLHEGPHAARHYQFVALDAGIAIDKVSRFMGHASITITIDRYGHLLPGGEADAIALLDAYHQRHRED